MHDIANPLGFMYLLFYRMCYTFYITVPSFKYSWSISHILEHKFFFLGRFGSVFFNSLIFYGHFFFKYCSVRTRKLHNTSFMNFKKYIKGNPQEFIFLLFEEIVYIMSQFSSILLGMIDQWMIANPQGFMSLVSHKKSYLVCVELSNIT